ncbi:MAG TPA: MTAP family purine nucleoside phosphorylase [Methanoregula sp.]|nr:MTAP family purine nucleoside phosphorylase [Methanoregula sp.]
MLGIIGGTSLLFSTLPDLEKRQIDTPFGNAEVLMGDVVILMRHQRHLPPHRINFRANMAALALAGAERIIAFGSSGSMNRTIVPGSLVLPADYLSISENPSIHDHAVNHIMPELSPELSHELHRLIPETRLGGTYVQTKGPRFETVAEIAALSRFADLVGMTLASEATLARELSIPFAAICTVDNYANGIADRVLTWDEVLEISRHYRGRTEKILNTIIRQMA